jgi:hypothetical protein
MSTSYIKPPYMVHSTVPRKWKTESGSRKPMKIYCNPEYSPSCWIRALLRQRPHGDTPAFHYHLVAATFEVAYPLLSKIPEYSYKGRTKIWGHSGVNLQVGEVTYCVTPTLTKVAMQSCRKLKAGTFVLVRNLAQLRKASRYFALRKQNRVEIVDLKTFLACTIVLMSLKRHAQPFHIFSEIIDAYNDRVMQTTADMTIQIDGIGERRSTRTRYEYKSDRARVSRSC